MEVKENILQYVKNAKISESTDELFFTPMPTTIVHISK